jgi:nucleotide-binding universal stress UspA family protein
MPHSHLIGKILVAADGSDPSFRAAQYAADIAACDGAEVTLIYALEATGVTEFVKTVIPGNESSVEELRQTGFDIIEKTKKPFLEADVATHGKVIEGFAADVIIAEARGGDYDLIAMGSCGMGAGILKPMVFGLGSVAQRVLGSPPCPVLVAGGWRGDDRRKMPDACTCGPGSDV